MSDGARASNHLLTVCAAPNGLDHPRLGLVVGARHGNAVRRSRIKRLIREAFRLSRPQLLCGLDLVCIPHRGAPLELAALRRSLVELSRRLRRRLKVNDE